MLGKRPDNFQSNYSYLFFIYIKGGQYLPASVTVFNSKVVTQFLYDGLVWIETHQETMDYSVTIQGWMNIRT